MTAVPAAAAATAAAGAAAAGAATTGTPLGFSTLKTPGSAAELALRFPLGHEVAAGTFDDWLQAKGKLGGQHKVPRLVNDRSIVDALLAAQKEPEQGELA